MNRYLGTKTKILDELESAISAVANSPAPTVCDIFSGSLAVSLHLKRKGYSVIANDINDLSYVYGKAYIRHNSIPRYPTSALFAELSDSERRRLDHHAAEMLAENRTHFDASNRYREFTSWQHYCSQLRPTARLLAYFQHFQHQTGDNQYDRSDIVDYYTATGIRSAFISARGTRGNRNYFSAANARIIDHTLNHIRYWFVRGMITEFQRCSLISILLDTSERYANIQGTYHDFPRITLESRARKALQFRLPDYFGLLHAKRKHWLGNRQDSLHFIHTAPKHDVLYVDPPYNFRQYTAYYSLPNFFCHHSLVADLDAYLSRISFVRGQNMCSDFSSPFCARENFLPSLRKLISAAKCQYVVLSYFDGVNHWNRFLAQDNNIGYKLLKKFFLESGLFDPKTLRVVPIARTNYQSQNGHKSKTVREFLYIARKKW